jgi:hypothetical protein
MKNRTGIAALSAVVFIASSPAGMAQDYFRRFATQEYLQPTQAPTVEEEEKYNMAVGPVLLSLAAGIGVEWNDNIGLVETGRESDFIIRPSVTVDAAWRISDLNVLRFSLGVGYAKYLNNSDYDSQTLLLSPNSAIGLTVQLGQVRVTLRDRFSYQEDPFDLRVGQSNGPFRRFENSAGIQADWDINEFVTVTGGYEHYNIWSVDSEEFSSLDRAIDTIYLRPAYRVTPNVTLGVLASASYINYDSSDAGDGTGFLFGPFVDIAISDSLNLYVEGGLQTFDFDSSESGDTDDSGSISTWYGRITLNHQISDGLSHRLSFTRTVEPGIGFAYYEIYRVEYGAVWQVTPSLVIDPTAFYEHFEASDVSGEEADRWGAALAMRYILTPSITLGADYRYAFKDSNLPDSSYYQNLVLLSLYYNF